MSKARENEVTRKMLRRALRVLDLDTRMHHVVLIKSGSSLANKDTVERIGNAMAHSSINGLVCVVNDFDDLTVLDELKMMELGWMRVPSQTVADSLRPEDRQADSGEALSSP